MLETKTEGSNSTTAGEIDGHVLIPGVSLIQSGYRASTGRAFDVALAKSVNELVTKIWGARADIIRTQKAAAARTSPNPGILQCLLGESAATLGELLLAQQVASDHVRLLVIPSNRSGP